MAQPVPLATNMSVEEFLVYASPEGKAELVRGELRVSPPAGGPHAVVSSNVVALLVAYVKQHGLGRVFPDGTGFELVPLPRTVRVPDASFVRADRLPARGVAAGLLKMIPDLAVEILSPSETASDLEEKLSDYRACGTPLIWVIDPDRRTVMVVAANAPLQWLHEPDTLEGGSVIPEFSCAVSELFDGLARPSC